MAQPLAFGTDAHTLPAGSSPGGTSRASIHPLKTDSIGGWGFLGGRVRYPGEGGAWSRRTSICNKQSSALRCWGWALAPQRESEDLRPTDQHHPAPWKSDPESNSRAPGRGCGPSFPTGVLPSLANKEGHALSPGQGHGGVSGNPPFSLSFPASPMWH